MENENLLSYLDKHNISKSDLVNKVGLSSRTVAKLSKGEKISMRTIQRIAAFLNCDVNELLSVDRSNTGNPVLNTLREEKLNQTHGRLYHELQVRMTYNSSHIEGSRLTEEQTRFIFETKTMNAKFDIPVNDIIETVHHFRAIDFIIDTAEEVLTEDYIKKIHYILFRDTIREPWFQAGNYKTKANIVGGRETVKPRFVHKKVEELLHNYNSKSEINIYDVIAFHADFECIHPFQDGNGRVGRLIAFKECLRNNIVPFIIEDIKKSYYYNGLMKWPLEKEWLNDTCLDGQDTFKAILDALEIRYQGSASSV